MTAQFYGPPSGANLEKFTSGAVMFEVGFASVTIDEASSVLLKKLVCAGRSGRRQYGSVFWLEKQEELRVKHVS
jgi:hypothetical protein